MPGFEEEALARARQLQQRSRGRTQTQSERQQPSQKEKPQKTVPETEENAEEKEQSAETVKASIAPAGGRGFLDLLFHDKENSVILTLLLLLMGEENSGEAVLALMYLLS